LIARQPAGEAQAEQAAPPPPVLAGLVGNQQQLAASGARQLAQWDQLATQVAAVQRHLAALGSTERRLMQTQQLRGRQGGM
jgi:hypothetical protein